MSRRAHGPFGDLSRSDRRHAMGALAAAALAQVGPLLALERRMRRTGGPGIIPFELAGPEKARRIMDTWGPEGRAAAKVQLVLDYPFPATYAPLHALACAATADAFRDRERSAFAAVGGPLAWGQLAAGGFDYIENTTLLLALAGRDGRLPSVARRAAQAKFMLLIAGWLYMLIGWVITTREVRRRDADD